MNIIIDEKLRELRSIRGNKQEDLAEHIGVSTQSVSKWERGETMPDITFLPKIASYYDVTVDELLGVGEIKKREKLQEYVAKSRQLIYKGLVNESIEVMRQAYKEFPNDMTVIDGLMFVLDCSHHDKYFEEIIALGERILSKSTDDGLRKHAIQILCHAHNKRGNQEKAMEYAQMTETIYTSREVLLSRILDGGEGIQQKTELMLKCLSIIVSAEMQICNSSDDERILQLHEFSLKMMELFFDDGFYGTFALCAERCHKRLAKIYLCRKNDEQKALESLKAAMKFAIQYDSLPDQRDSIVYTSTILNGLDNFSTIFGVYAETECELLLKSLDDSEFDSVRDKDWFKALVEELKAAK